MKRLLKVFMIFFLALVLCTGIAAADLADGLVGYWPLDGNGDDVVGDSEGELVGGAEWTNDGRLNGGVRLDGATGYVAISGFTELITTEITCVA